MEPGSEKAVVETISLELKSALESGGELRRAVTNAELAMVELSSVRARATADLIKSALERQTDFTDAYKLRFRGEVLLNAYQDWGAEITVKEAALGR